MSRTQPTRQELVAAIIAQGRANSTGTVLMHAAIAERLGLNPSDHKCADLMQTESEPCTPGRLAELTGLSTGAITGVIDRLERAGFLVREHDRKDRRRVLLRLTHARGPELHALFAPLAERIEALCVNFKIAELAVVLRFMREIQGVTEVVSEQLRRGPLVSGERGPEQPAASTRVRASQKAVRRPRRASKVRVLGAHARAGQRGAGARRG
jgi:DNA-binding MarR family transcriptional regulator